MKAKPFIRTWIKDQAQQFQKFVSRGNLPEAAVGW